MSRVLSFGSLGNGSTCILLISISDCLPRRLILGRTRQQGHKSFMLSPHSLTSNSPNTSVIASAKSHNLEIMAKDGMFSRTWLHTLLVILSTNLFVFVAYFVQTTFSSQILDANNRLSALDVSTTLAVLRALQGLLYLLTSAVLSKSFGFLMWGKMNRPAGLRYLSLLALSETTGYLGAIKIIFSPISKWSTKFWAMLRCVGIGINPSHSQAG